MLSLELNNISILNGASLTWDQKFEDNNNQNLVINADGSELIPEKYLSQALSKLNTNRINLNPGYRTLILIDDSLPSKIKALFATKLTNNINIEC